MDWNWKRYKYAHMLSTEKTRRKCYHNPKEARYKDLVMEDSTYHAQETALELHIDYWEETVKKWRKYKSQNM